MTACKHHFLVAGNVLFLNNPSGNMGSVPLNGILLTDTKDIPAASLAKAQQVLQIRFFKQVENSAEVTVMDVVLQTITYLGEFTEEEFQAPPQGMSLQEASSQLVAAVEQAASSESANG